MILDEFGMIWNVKATDRTAMPPIMIARNQGLWFNVHTVFTHSV